MITHMVLALFWSYHKMFDLSGVVFSRSYFYVGWLAIGIIMSSVAVRLSVYDRWRFTLWLDQSINLNDTSYSKSVWKSKKKVTVLHSRRWKYSVTQLRSVTCHMGSHGVTCHPTQVNTPHLNPSQTAGTWFTHPGGMEGWVDLVDLIALRPGVEQATFRSRV